ncbi:MAG: fasciclin domain-containing protein [Phycisphaerales bacterium]
MKTVLNLSMLTLSAGLAASAYAGGCNATASAKSDCGDKQVAQQAVAQPASWNGGEKSWGEKADIVDTAVAAGSFKTLAAALKAAGLVDTLKGEGPFTVFAPTDEAFAKLPAGTVESLLRPENKDKLVSILTYHVVPGKVKAESVVDLKGAETVNGQRVSINSAYGSVKVDGAKVVKTDVMASNGVIHVIDSVILPSEKNLVETAKAAGSLNTLAAALDAAGLVSALEGDGPFTVFAPTDEAFAKLPEGTVANLLKPENREQLRSILLYHVVEGRVFSEDVVNLDTAMTLQGSTIDITAKYGVKVDNAKVIKTDVNATNGVIHVIDSVILPN